MNNGTDSTHDQAASNEVCRRKIVSFTAVVLHRETARSRSARTLRNLNIVLNLPNQKRRCDQASNHSKSVLQACKRCIETQAGFLQAAQRKSTLVGGPALFRRTHNGSKTDRQHLVKGKERWWLQFLSATPGPLRLQVTARCVRTDLGRRGHLVSNEPSRTYQAHEHIVILPRPKQEFLRVFPAVQIRFFCRRFHHLKIGWLSASYERPH